MEASTDGVLPQAEPAAQNSAQELVKLEDSDQKYYFGCRCWHPKWLQVLANPKFYTFCLCVATVIEGSLVNGFCSIVISSIERRYRFNSTAVGFLLVSFDLSVLFCIIFISYFGAKRHKPRWIGYGVLLQGIGALVFAFPQFIFGSYRTGITGNLTLQACVLTGDAPSADCSSSNALAYCIILFGNVLIGIGSSPLYTIGISYIDDITLPKYVPLHLGALYVCLVLGPALGYALGGIFLSIFVDPWVDTDVTEIDPGWVGGWWIGFILSGVASLIAAVPFFLFPRILPNYDEVVKARQTQHARVYESKFGEEKSLVNQLKAFPRHLLDLLKSPSFVFVSLGLSFHSLPLYGMVSFGPKFIESVFNIPASTSSLLAGAVAIPTGGLGAIVGTVIAYVLKADTKKVSIVSWVGSILAIPFLFGFFVSCPSLEIAGITMPYANASYVSTNDVTISSCNYDCMCTSSIYEPVCGADDLTYFSPCRAGCMKRPDENDLSVTIFENCTCIADNQQFVNSTPYLEAITYSNSTDGKCPQSCNTLGLWLFLIGVVFFFIFVIRVPTLLITLRAVAEEQRSLALGVQSILWRAVGSIPGPLLYGVIFDTSCIYWQEECGRRGNCWVYNNDSISIRAFFLSLFGVAVNTVFMILCWVFYPPVTCSKKIKETSEMDKEENGPSWNHQGRTVSNPVFNPDEVDSDKAVEAATE